MVTFFRVENRKSKNQQKKCKLLSTFLLLSVETFESFAKIYTSITIPVTGIAMIVLPKSAKVVYGITLGIKKTNERVMQNSFKPEKLSERVLKVDILLINCKGIVYLQGNTVDKNEYESFCKFFPTMLMKSKNYSSSEKNFKKGNSNFFSKN